MAGRRTNLALGGLLATALATGTVAFAVGTPVGRFVTVAHAVAGLGVVALSPWKAVIVRRAMPRRGGSRWLSVIFGILVLTAVASGVAHAGGWYELPLGLVMMQVHVGAALAAIPFGVWHIAARPLRPHRHDASRRNLLRSTALLGGAGALYAGGEGLWRVASLPGAQRRFTGSHERGTDQPSQMPVVLWLFDRVPRIDGDAWACAVTGVDGTREIGHRELSSHEDSVRATIDCTGGWYATQDWGGARLDRLLGDPEGAASIAVRSVTGYTRRFPADDARHLWLATTAAGNLLSPGHGFPARLVAPGRRGFWWVKWVQSVTWDPQPWWLQPPFPLQ